MKPPVATVFLIILILHVFSCKNHKDRTLPVQNAAWAPGVVNAERFTLVKNDSCTILTIIDPWQGAKTIRHVFYLVNKNAAPLFKADPASVISVPVKSIVCMSSTHVAMIAALGEKESITGISGTNFIYDTLLQRRADRGLINEIGYDAAINNELILKLSPDLIMMYGIGSESSGYVGKLNELGIKIMYNADYLEEGPLGKAEWIKVFGALYSKEAIADSIFNSISVSYNNLKDSIAEVIRGRRPVVLLGLPFRDTWFISPGNSYVSNLISDAGGDYLWKETKSSFSMPYSFESVYMKSLKADFWLNSGTVSSKAEIVAFDPRLQKIPSFVSGNIYNNTMRLSAGGGNDYWESGTLKPDILLRDIASILHPDMLRDHKLVYYKKIN